MEPETTAFDYPFQNPDLPAEERIDSILGLLTLEEKVFCLGTDPSIPRLGIKGSGHVEGLHGLAMGEPGGWGKFDGDKQPVATTTFPQEIGLGQTWDPIAVQEAAAIEGYEVRYMAQSDRYKRGGLVVRAPNADLGRDPRWGRTEECYGEDPFLNGTLTQAFVRGLQGDHPVYWQSASLMKHFLANSNEDGRESSSSDFDERLFREYYSVPFRMGIEAGSRAYMAAYNSYNGIPCAVHPMLKEITVAEWGNDGIICTDGGAMKLLVTDHKAFPDQAQACAAIVKAGIGQFLDDHSAPTTEALETGLLTEAEVDAALRGDFRVMLRLGLLDPPGRVPYSKIGADGEAEPWLSETSRTAVRSVTRKSAVLLKNSGGLLPLDRGAGRSLAVLGPRADTVLLDWYSGSPPYAVTPLAGIREAVGAGASVQYADGGDAAAAVALAASSDVAIVVVGNNPVGAGGWAKVNSPDEGREAVDRQSISLEPGQEELIKQVYAANPRTVVVLLSSFPYAINWAQENVPAILHLTQNSQEQGNALADVLFGDYNPGGRLVQTWPASLEQLPPMMDYDIRNGRTYQYFQGKPLYPFGYGLSYTTFGYANLRTSADAVTAGGAVEVSVDVTNTGERAGDEVVQLYVKHLDSAVERPPKALKGFARVTLAPGEMKTVTLPLPASLLSYWDAARHGFVVEDGAVQLLVGASSADIRQEMTLRVEA